MWTSALFEKLKFFEIYDVSARTRGLIQCRQGKREVNLSGFCGLY